MCGHQSSVHVCQKQVRVGLVDKVARWASSKPRAYRCSELERVKRKGRRQYYFIKVNVIDGIEGWKRVDGIDKRLENVHHEEKITSGRLCSSTAIKRSRHHIDL